jgi:hypothetical protein
MTSFTQTLNIMHEKTIGPKDMANNTIVTMDMVCNPIFHPHDSGKSHSHGSFAIAIDGQHNRHCSFTIAVDGQHNRHQKKIRK